ncbi:GIY-YIG nuclease family protein [Candidatus Parcubacteria bacterium]|nr:GIY-YIG nuclease family protein [Candidatus Parcubacteria bacterium]
MFCYVYVLSSNYSKKLYVGFTTDLRKRVAEHNKGLNFSTKAYAPWKLLYYEAHRSEADARRREKYLKTTPGNKTLKKMLREEFSQMKNLNNGKSTTGYA